MLIAVSGSSGLDQVVGVASAAPGALLPAVRTGGAEHVLLLAPRHRASLARQQAHVVIAADPAARVAVLTFDQHALTLTLAAALVLQRAGGSARIDPGAAVQLVSQVAARSRSIVWHPRAWAAGSGGEHLEESRPTLGQRMSSLVRRPGYFAEVGVPAGLISGRLGLLLGPDERLWCAGEPPALLRSQLGDRSCTSVQVSFEAARPYAGRGAVELTGLGSPTQRTLDLQPCGCCGAGAGADGCVYCSTRRPVGSASHPTGPGAQRGSPAPLSHAAAQGVRA